MTLLYQSLRRALKDKILEQLKTQNATDARHFFKNPFRAVDAEEELPCIRIGIMNGVSAEFNNRPAYTRTDTVTIAYITKGNDELTDILDFYAEQIEKFLINEFNINQFGGLIDWFEPKSFTMQMEEGQAGIGAAVMTFEAKYRTDHSPALDYLTAINVEIRDSVEPSTAPPLFTETIALPIT